MTRSRHRKTPASAVNHRTKSPKSPENPTTLITKSPETHSKVFTETDEIHLLKTLSQSPSLPGHCNNSNFTDTQINNKIYNLKKKYHKLARSKNRIKTLHDVEVYEIGRTIWGRNKEVLVVSDEEGEGEVNLDDYPFLVNEIMSVFKRNEYCKEGLRRLGKKKLKEMNEKWMELKLDESELMMNKSQLYNEYLKVVVEGSKSS